MADETEAAALGRAVGGLSAFIAAHLALSEKVAALEARVAQLEQAAAHNAPAMQAAWMHVPIGGAR